MAWLASDFLLELRRACGIASSSGASPEGLTDADLLPVIDREIQLSLMPVLLRAREEYLVLKTSVAVTGATTRVRVPSRAIAGRLRDIRQTVNGMDRPLTRYSPEEKSTLFPGVSASGALVGYYLEGEWIVLLGSPLVSQTLDIYFLARPGRLTVTASDFQTITGFGGGAGTNIVVASNAGFTPGQLLDFVRGDSGLSPVSVGNLLLGTIGGTQLSLTDPTPVALLQIGDYVCVPEKTPVIPLPVELHPLLLSRATSAVMRQLGKYDAANAEDKTGARFESMASTLLQPRVESQSKVVVGTFHWRSRRRGGGRSW